MTDTLKDLVDSLVSEGVLKTKSIKDAFHHVDRKDFVDPDYEDEAYNDTALPIGYGQTISQPYTVAFMLELLQPQKNGSVLDVGSGSGWTTALLADIVGTEGSVQGVELVPGLVEFGQDNLAKYDFPHAQITQATEELGLAKYAPYDRILVSAGNTAVPKKLVDQLRDGGVMVLPVGSAILKVTKISSEETEEEKFEGFAFVPLVHGD